MRVCRRCDGQGCPACGGEGVILEVDTSGEYERLLDATRRVLRRLQAGSVVTIDQALSELKDALRGYEACEDDACARCFPELAASGRS